jgi:iron complex outermembrane receptor protein
VLRLVLETAEASKELNLTVDYWNIRKTDPISTLGEQIIVENPARYKGKTIQRDESAESID